VIDLDIAEANIHRLQSWANDHGVGVRPHSKTHKTPLFAKKQIDAGAVGVCCAKVGEAEEMVAGGIRDVLIANQVIGEAKIRRLVALAAEANVVVAAESEENIRQPSAVASQMGHELGVIIEVNTGMNRCGTGPGDPTTQLAKLVASVPGVGYDGLMWYEGHCVAGRDFEVRKTEAERAARKLLDAADHVRAAGLPVNIVSAAGTGTYNITGAMKGITDLQCGSYIFMDGDYLEVFDDFKSALSVLSTVISRSGNQAVIDCGKKSISEDRGFPIVIDPPGAVVKGVSEEHVRLEVSGPAASLKIGDKVSLRPMHGDTTINMHSHYFGVRHGVLEAAIEIAGRGRFR